MAESDLKFSAELTSNFNALCARSDQEITVVKDLLDYFKKRAELEADYGKKLNIFYKTLPGAGVFTKEPPILKETKTIKDAVLSINEKGVAVSDSHVEISNKINNEIVKALDSWLKTKDVERKKIIGDGQKHLKAMGDSKANVQKARILYEKLWKESDLAKDQLIKAEKDEINQPEKKNLNQVTKKANQTYQQAQEKAKQQETAYKSALQSAVKDFDSFTKEKIPSVLEQFQKWEEDRISTLVTIVKAYKTIQSGIPGFYEKEVQEIETLIQGVNVKSDLKELIDSCKKQPSDFNPQNDEKLEFVAYKSKHEDSSSSSQNTATTTSNAPPPTPSPTTASVPESKPSVAVESSFSTQTAEEKLEKAEEEPKVAPAPVKKELSEEEKKKAQQLKDSLFGANDDSSDIFG